MNAQHTDLWLTVCQLKQAHRQNPQTLAVNVAAYRLMRHHQLATQTKSLCCQSIQYTCTIKLLMVVTYDRTWSLLSACHLKMRGGRKIDCLTQGRRSMVIDYYWTASNVNCKPTWPTPSIIPL